MPVPSFDSWPFALRVVFDPVRALDLLDGHKVPDHTKIVPLLTMLGIFALKLVHVPITVMEMTVLLTAAFGQSAWRMFLRQKTLTGTANSTSTFSEAKTVIENTTRQILERRDPTEGVDPTHE